LLSKGQGSENARFFVRNQNLSEETGTLIGACRYIWKRTWIKIQ